MRAQAPSGESARCPEREARTRLQGKVAAGLGRHGAVEGAIDRAGHAGARGRAVQGVAGAREGRGARRGEGVAVEIADREVGRTRTEIVAGIKAAGGEVVGVVIGYRTNRV